ncbi:MAG: lipid A biosynthesis lauroyl acyltransferase [Pseudomonadota bacterium]
MTELIIRKLVIALRNIRDWTLAQLFFGFIAVLKLFPADGAIWFVAEATRGLGMWYPRTKLARQNLKLAFPEKSEHEIEDILREMWANMGRIAAEYVYLDQIFDIDEDDQSKGRVEITGAENFHAMKDHDGPVICFTGHTGNWELLPIASAVYGLNITALFRPPNNRFIARRVLSARTTAMGHLVPSKVGASWSLANILEEKGTVGMLVDQFFGRGTEITFFGRQTMANPLLAKLTRQFDCPVFPARCMRLPGGRFKIDIEPEVKRHYREDGSLNTDRLTQDVNACVERWVREYPDQWLWLHKRWRPDFMKKRAERLAQKAKSNTQKRA